MSRAARTEPIGKLTKGLWVPDEQLWSKEEFCVPAHYKSLIDGILLTRGQIRDRLEKVANDMYEHYRDVTEDIVLVVTLKGAVTVFQELSQALRRIAHNDMRSGPNRSCYLEQYVVCSSYHGVTRGELGVDPDIKKALEYCKGKHVIIVEDLVDTGNTLERLHSDFSALMKDPAKPCDVYRPEPGEDMSNHVLSVRSVVGFSKRTPAWNGFVPDWVAFDVKDVWLVGFGCDVDNHYRDLDHLATISEAGKLRYVEK